MAMRPELAVIDVARMHGLEIGPLASPRVRKDEGPVRYVDHASADELRQKYSNDRAMQNSLDQIVEVDYLVGENKSLSEAVARDAPFEYVIASHVIEHIPDPVGWLADVANVLTPGGILSLVIPDKRYCFDINRALTEISDIVDAHLRQLRRPSFRQAYDFWSKSIGGMVDTAAVWAGTAQYSGVVRQDFDDPDAAALEACREMQESDQFVDVHCHVFTPDSFLALFEQMARLKLIDFEMAELFPTEFNNLEFYVSLRRLDPLTSRDVMLERQRASAARARAQVQSRGPVSTRAQSSLSVMEVSERERRLLDFKRRWLGRLRSLLRRG
ncbi:MAG: class I SAM-dependent methyltransferase [Candidatus Dormibacteria bacterium]